MRDAAPLQQRAAQVLIALLRRHRESWALLGYWVALKDRTELSRLLRGEFREHSLERLLRFLVALGCDVDIVIRQANSSAGGKLRIAASEEN